MFYAHERVIILYELATVKEWNIGEMRVFSVADDSCAGNETWRKMSGISPVVPFRMAQLGIMIISSFCWSSCAIYSKTNDNNRLRERRKKNDIAKVTKQQ